MPLSMKEEQYDLPGSPAGVPRDFTEFMTSMGAAAKKVIATERTYLELLVSDRVARVGSGVAIAVLMLFLGLVAVLLAVFAGAKAWGDALGSEAMGYLATSGVVAVSAVVLALASAPLKRWLKVRLINTLHGHDR